MYHIRWPLLFTLVLLLSISLWASGSGSVGERIEALWGSSMTAGELLSAVAPDLLAVLPSGIWDARVVWEGEDFRFAWIGDDQESDERKPPSAKGLWDIYLDWTSKLYVRGKDVQYGSSTTVISPPFLRLPLMAVTSQLLEDGRMIDICGETDYNVWRVTENDSHHVSGAAYYQAMGYHYSEAPPGYWPPSALLVSHSVMRWIDE